jgi:cytochrome c-type biogenesis protein CcmH/NrfG
MVCLTRVYFVILLLAKKERQMDEREQEYLKHQIRELRRSNHRWKIATFALAAAFVIFLIVGGGSSVLFGVRLQMERALAAEQAARLQAEQAAQQLQQMEKRAKEKAEKNPNEQGAKEGGAADKPDDPALKKVEVAPRN